MQADSCGCLEGEEQFDDSIATCGDSDEDGDSDDEQRGKIFLIKFLLINSFLLNLEFQANISLSATQIGTNQFDEIDLEDEAVEDCQKEMQRLL